MQTSAQMRREIAKLYSVVIVARKADDPVFQRPS